jgi:calcineurin-like phosphoesterase family protein
MATYFCVSDVHSFYYEMMEALNDTGFDINNKNHVFVSLGDLLDRGPDPKECLEFVNSIPKNRKILIKGNHERLLQECIKTKQFKSHDFYNKTFDTALILTDCTM